MKKTKLKPLFKTDESWKKYWKGMPEFNQEDLTPYKSIYVHFENEKDMQEFSKLVGQKILVTTQSIWYPKAKIGKISDKIYVTKGYKKRGS